MFDDTDPDYGTPIGAARPAGPNDPEPDYANRPTVDDINALHHRTVRVTMVGREYEAEDFRVFDNVRVGAAPIGPAGEIFMVAVLQQLIPEWGDLSYECDAEYFSHEILEVTPTDRIYPVRRTYKAAELKRWEGLGALLTVVLTPPDRPIERGTLVRNVMIDAVEGENVHLSQGTSFHFNEYGNKVATTSGPFARPVPIADLAFIMRTHPGL